MRNNIKFKYNIRVILELNNKELKILLIKNI